MTQITQETYTTEMMQGNTKGSMRDSNGNDLPCAQHSTTHATWPTS